MWLKLVEFFAALIVYVAGIEPRFVVRNDETAASATFPQRGRVSRSPSSPALVSGIVRE